MSSTISQRDSKVIWHPYTPMKIFPEARAFVSGRGARLTDEDGHEWIDAISSWWVNIHGHAHPYIAAKVSEQLSRLEHSIFAGFTHEPAVTLAERLLPLMPGMARIFYSDNGSTAVEVALKMASQYHALRGDSKRTRIVAIEDAYQWDTFGAMSVSGRGVFTHAFRDMLFDVTFIPFGGPGNEAQSIEALRTVLQQGDTAAFIAEPLVQGSGGMKMYSAEVLEAYFSLCHAYGALVIDDEVMTGFGRTGPLFACDAIETRPDIMCLSKGLTGGFLPMGITATTQQVYDAFYSDDRSKMLYHGHSYTGNATICAAALASLDLVLSDECSRQRAFIAEQHRVFAGTLAGHPAVSSIRQTGTILAIELATDQPSYHAAMRDQLYKYFCDRYLLMRPLGNIIYILPPYCISEDDLQCIYSAIRALPAKWH